jgi:hypothetical protein
MPQPVFLLADSQPLFPPHSEGPLPGRLRAALAEAAAAAGAGETPNLSAAYLGASNGDDPAFYDLFRSAMGPLGIRSCRHVPAAPSGDDLAFLERADLVLLAGGDPLRGLEAFRAAGIDTLLVARYYGEAVLVGVSAGAVQLGLRFWSEGVDGAAGRDVDGLRIVPSLIDVHDEPDWERLRRLVGPELPAGVSAVGIPAGGAAVYHPDAALEPLGRPLLELRLSEEGLREAMIFPGEAADDSTSAADSTPPAADEPEPEP